MSLRSARNFVEKQGDIAGYCFPLSLDSILTHTDLPQKYYELYADAYHNNTGFNPTISTLLKGFFATDPQPDTDTAPKSVFHAYGASPQTYMPDVPYEFPVEKKAWGRKVSQKQLRIRELIKTAAERKCLIIIDAPGQDNGHYAGPQLVEHASSGYSSLYAVRDNTYLQDRRLYDSNALSGIHDEDRKKSDSFAPLPEFAKSYIADGQTSPILIILPAEPMYQTSSY